MIFLSFFLLISISCIFHYKCFCWVWIVNYSRIFFWTQVTTIKNSSYDVRCDFLNMQESGLRLVHEIAWIAEPSILARPTVLSLLTECRTWAVEATYRCVCWGFVFSSFRRHVLLYLTAHLGVQVLAVLLKQLARDKWEELGLLWLAAHSIAHLANVFVCLLESVVVCIFLSQLGVIKLFLSLPQIVVSTALVYVFAFLPLGAVEQLPTLLGVLVDRVNMAFKDLLIAQLAVKHNSASKL